MSESKPIVLIADDEPLSLHVMTDVLSAEYTVKAAENGEEALALACASPRPDLILLDIQMPEMDGYTVCERLKADALTRDIPIIFMTALKDEKDERHGLALGAVDYISKPLRPAILAARIRTHLGLKAARAALAERNAELEQMLRVREAVEEITRHDLKSPLNGILGATHLLLEDEMLQGENRELLEMQEEAGYNMLEMINRSMDMLKMELGSYEVVAESVDLLEVIQNVIRESYHTEFSVLIEGRPPEPDEVFMVRGEVLLYYSMLSNLVKNAVEAGGTTDRVTLLLANEKDHPSIQVRNAQPVPAAVRARFFDKYATSGKRSGTGLGTYSARLIAETLGGRIWLETSEEVGTIITIDCCPGAASDSVSE
jgi:CheY-like chemotaxis protein